MTWHRYWLIWFLVSFFSFLGPEIYALVTDYRRTLSESIWWMEGFHGDASFRDVGSWTALHFLFGGAFLLTVIWLAGHFLFHLWH